MWHHQFSVTSLWSHISLVWHHQSGCDITSPVWHHQSHPTSPVLCGLLWPSLPFSFTPLHSLVQSAWFGKLKSFLWPCLQLPQIHLNNTWFMTLHWPWLPRHWPWWSVWPPRLARLPALCYWPVARHLVGPHCVKCWQDSVELCPESTAIHCEHTLLRLDYS